MNNIKQKSINKSNTCHIKNQNLGHNKLFSTNFSHNPNLKHREWIMYEWFGRQATYAQPNEISTLQANDRYIYDYVYCIVRRRKCSPSTIQMNFNYQLTGIGGWWTRIRRSIETTRLTVYWRSTLLWRMLWVLCMRVVWWWCVSF